MKQNHKNINYNNKNNLTLTAQVADALKSINKKATWKNKTNKLTKTLAGKTLNSKPTPMTEQDIDLLFKNHSKEKLKQLGPTKVSTQVVQSLGFRQHRDFINSVKFLRIDDEWDRLLTGLPSADQNKIDSLFEVQKQQEKDLTVQFKKDYLVGKIIGQGAYASVRVAVFKPLNKKIAIKVYEKNKIKEPQRKKSVRREIRILQILNHPNIVKIHDVVETNNHLNIIMEYLPGISLGAYLKAQPNKKVAQKNCKIIFKQLVKALAYMHSHNIAHRDIKLENIILDENLSPKLIDFGFSTCIQTSKKVKIFCGTPSYMAPEVIERKEYRGETADIWALGVLLFVSLTGLFPFKGATDQQLYKKINNADYPKGQLFFSKAASDLVAKMLKISSQQRITAKQILGHAWFGEGKVLESSSKKAKRLDSSNDHRKRINTISSNHSKENKWANKTNKKVLAETCKQNLHLEIKMAMKSPSNKKQINSYRKVDKQNILKGLKSEKATFRETQNPANAHKKDKLGKTHSKVIDLLRMQMKKREKEKSKSKSRRI